MYLAVTMDDVAAETIDAVDGEDEPRPPMRVGAFEGYIYREVEDDS